MVREPGDPAPDVVEYRHGLTPPMRDARKRRFRREPDLNVIITSFLFEDVSVFLPPWGSGGRRNLIRNGNTRYRLLHSDVLHYKP